MIRQSHHLVLKWAEMIAPEVRHLAFALESDEPFVFIPGQFITLMIQSNDKLLRRSYSIANRRSCENLIEFAAAYVKGGIATQLLFNLQPGEKVTATGPFGRLILRDEQPARYILMATGTGVTPYRAMLNEIADRLEKQPELQIVLLFGVRKPEELLYREEFVNLAKINPRFDFKAYYSRAPSQQAYEYQGHIQNSFADISPNPEKDIVYLCGNPNMIDDTFALLTQLGFPTQNVRREKYISSS